MEKSRPACHLADMSFDADPESPDKMVEPQKATTKINFALVVGVLLFLAIGVVALVLLARRGGAG
jgi:hypothetical protein